MNMQDVEEQYNAINYKYKNVLTDRILRKVHNLPVEDNKDQEVKFDPNAKIYHKKYLRYKGKLSDGREHTSEQ